VGRETIGQSELPYAMNQQRQPQPSTWTERTKVTFEQNFLHLRHMENERLLFTTVWGAVLGGSLTLLAKDSVSLSDDVARAVIIFLMIFTALGIVLSCRLGVVILDLYRRQRLIADSNDIEAFVAAIYPPPGWLALTTVGAVFPVLYATTFGLLSFLLYRAFA
jgi:hypothetical protein